MPRKISEQKRAPKLRFKIVAVLISLYVHFTGFFTRYIMAGSQASADLDKRQRVIYAFWHNQQTFLLYPYRKRGKICVLVSSSKDGEYIARALPKFKMKAMRGSSTRGGYSALRGLMDIAQAGYSPAITPDGPRGPIYHAHAGVIYLAQKTRLPIIAAGVACSNKFAVNSWDKFQVPLPFGKCAIVYAEPVWVGETDDIEESRRRLNDYLNNATAEAKRLVGDKT
ncbi:MAG: lysophospholipid acyltransferase family protein [Elusimicrobiota bacterium]|jgi:lysophospholipid acyltransferase (LPLAT)-like uncharacterized protein|nr:lysophospholipid acyltransferase family protein [Elusimicrobiota bacterium]